MVIQGTDDAHQYVREGGRTRGRRDRITPRFRATDQRILLETMSSTVWPHLSTVRHAQPAMEPRAQEEGLTTWAPPQAPEPAKRG
jgi:hypothetical protein